MKKLVEAITNRSAKVAVIGLGYVGLSIASEIARAGFITFGIDTSHERVDAINHGDSYIKDVKSDVLNELIRDGKFKATTDFSLLGQCDFISICVPTPLGKGKDPDMSYIVAAVNEVKKYLRREQVIILESTTFPGTTDEFVLPLLEETGLKVGQDFYLAFSPERIDPGNKDFHLKNTPKIVGGATHNCTEIVQSFYQTFIDHVIPVSSSKAAEMVKLLENTFRAVNIGLANEIAIMCNYLGIDTWEVIDASATKPFGFMPFYPGPGLGGHCIPVDPHYLLWKLKLMDYNARFIQLADAINSSMPKLVTEKIASVLNDQSKPVKNSKILILGVAYKKNINDFRESPAIDVIHLLQKRGAIVSYCDPYIPFLRIDGINLESIPVNQNIGHYDCAVLLTDHSDFNISELVEQAPVFVDTRNATKRISGHRQKIVKL